MNEEEYHESLDHVKSTLYESRELTLIEKRRIDPSIIKANAQYSKRSAELARNYGMGIEIGGIGNISLQGYERQLDLLKQDLEEKENMVIRDGSKKLRDQLLNDYFEDFPEKLEQAKQDINNDPDLQWLKAPEDRIEPNKGKTKSSFTNEFEMNAGNAIPSVRNEFKEKGDIELSNVEEVPPLSDTPEIETTPIEEAPNVNERESNRPDIDFKTPEEVLAPDKEVEFPNDPPREIPQIDQGAKVQPNNDFYNVRADDFPGYSAINQENDLQSSVNPDLSIELSDSKDQIPGYSEIESETIQQSEKTKDYHMDYTAEDFPGYDTYTFEDSSNQPESGIQYTPDANAKGKSEPDMSVGDMD